MALNLRPRERSNLENLIVALQAGLDPMIALDLYQGIIQPALARMEAHKEAVRARREEQRNAIPGLYQLVLEQAASGVPSSVATEMAWEAAAAIPGFNDPEFRERLRENLKRFIPLVYPEPGEPSPYFTESMPTEFDEEDAAAVLELAQRGVPREEAKKLVIGSLQSSGVEDPLLYTRAEFFVDDIYDGYEQQQAMERARTAPPGLGPALWAALRGRGGPVGMLPPGR